MIDTLETDYRKWILFNNQLSDFQNLYELYTALDSKQSKGGVSIKAISTNGEVAFIIDQDGYEKQLELRGEVSRMQFLEYLIKHYFPNDGVEEWYQSKLEEKNKKENHSTSTSPKITEALADFKVHPKETTYYQLRVFFSMCFYLAILGAIVNAFFTSITMGVAGIIIIGVIILFFALVRRISHGFFIGLVKGSSVKLNEYQYPEVYKIISDQSKAIGLRQTPEVYISYGHFNAFVTKFAKRKFLVLYSEVLETTLKGDFEVLKFVVGHELGHLKRQHLSIEKWLAPSSFIPLLRQAHSRGCEYTCDRIGYHASNKGAMEGILILAAGKDIYSKISIEQYVEDSNSENDFWVWLSEKFLTHPHVFNRMMAIRSYDRKGY
jgi:Zn-dependent protease with chaperone function